jgi:short-subunit dehydrogenase
MAHLFRKSGCNVIITGSNSDKLAEISKQLPDDQPGKIWCIPCDLRDRSAVDETVKRLAKDCPPVDILINNVSITAKASGRKGD